jgi:hypothetical protein
MWIRPSSLVPSIVTSPRGFTKRAAGREGEVQRLVALVPVAEEFVKRVLIEVPASVVPSLSGCDVMSDDTSKHQEEQHEEDAKADAAAIGRALGIAHVDLIEGPLGQQHNAGRHQQQRPPMAIPAPEATEIETAGLNQQKDNADGDQQDGAENGAAAQAPHLGADMVAPCAGRLTLRAQLVAVEPPLRSRIVAGRWRWWRSRWRRWWRIARHDLPSFRIVVGMVFVGRNNS